MAKKTKSIPVRSYIEHFEAGAAVGKIVSEDFSSYQEAGHPHRHDFHFFHMLEKGKICMEVDFIEYKMEGPVILYIHPSQVHRTVSVEHSEGYMLGILNEKLNPEYLQLFNELVLPASPLVLTPDMVTLFDQAIRLCVAISEQKDNRLYTLLVKDYINAFAGMFLSFHLERKSSNTTVSRFSTVTHEFKLLLERRFAEIKRPAEYASLLHISVPYLNECIRNVTGHSVSYHIQQRVILEAKRILFHSSKSVKEVASELGYEDYAYFSRLFTKITGITPVAFRSKNLDSSK
ncbi:helix-turn-helix domain-containing protein [Xanthocytophaga flava]|uniref:helix-turn-helix domain-containing protein n=1 Tax=Xanthocytophaga flava TaxID=3048013 RepID=UPI0028D73F03|nr:AraC family transcriptional regulator [Xanthocytophaga flavus]MDJ1466776.1 AraC family transcriptional regulator [Xanthocytophaga flavus]